MLQKLLTREREMRLGSGPTDAEEIMSHAFFKGINWEDIYHKRIPPPFKPTVKNEKDTSNFDQEFTSVTPVLTPVQSGEPLFAGIDVWCDPLTYPGSSFTSNAGGIQRILIFGSVGKGNVTFNSKRPDESCFGLSTQIPFQQSHVISRLKFEL